MLEEFLPHYDVRETHSVKVAAEPEVVLRALRELTPREVPLFVVLMTLRAGPRARHLSARRRVLDQFERAGFVSLRDGPDGLAFGSVGRYWQLSGSLRRIEPGEFRDFAEPGYAKGAVDFRVEPQDGATLLTTETRVLATDETARRRFLRYWRLIHPGSAAIRVVWLRAIRRRAERYSSCSRRAESAASAHSAQTSMSASRRPETSASSPISGGPARKPA
jgi:hypothetical protein